MMNKFLIISISLLFSFSAMYSQTKIIEQTELCQECINSKKYIKQYSIENYNIKNPKTIKAYSSIQNIKEFVLMNALTEMTLQIHSDVASSLVEDKSEGDNIKSTTETSYSNSGYIYSKKIFVNVVRSVNIVQKIYDPKYVSNTYEESFQTMAQLIFKEDTISYSSVTITSNNDQSYNNKLTIGKNKNWCNDVINELKYNGMEFNFIEGKKKIELCISLKKDLIKKE